MGCCAHFLEKAITGPQYSHHAVELNLVGVARVRLAISLFLQGWLGRTPLDGGNQAYQSHEQGSEKSQDA